MTSLESGDEFAVIAELLQPLAMGSPEARGLIDDVALLQPPAGRGLVITTDTLIEGVHFLEDDPWDLVARKLLRVNLSDLAAKGADPYVYFLNLSWPRRASLLRRRRFVEGLALDQARFGLRLIGGDTTSTPGPLTISATLIGLAGARTPDRAQARPDDLLVVSGFIGDGRLGLQAATGGLSELEPARREALIGRYRLPEPRLALARVVRDYATASIDVSDGLAADAGHIADASGLSLVLDLDRTPLSRAARAWLDHRADPILALTDLVTGGDDYELALAIAPDRVDAALKDAARTGTDLHVVGRFEPGRGVRLRYGGQDVPTPESLGWRHG